MKKYNRVERIGKVFRLLILVIFNFLLRVKYCVGGWERSFLFKLYFGGVDRYVYIYI